MLRGRHLALCLVLAASAGSTALPAPAAAQSVVDDTALPPDAQAALDALLAGTNPEASSPSSGGAADPSVPQADGGGAISPSGSTPGGTTDTAPAPDDAEAPIAPTSPAPVSPDAAAAGSVPGPPPYLTAGQDAAVQPVSSVARLTDPDVPLEPVRIAALVALLLAALALLASVVLRALGLRTATPAAATPALATRGADGGLLTRARERTGLLLDDVRDFLRRSR